MLDWLIIGGGIHGTHLSLMLTQLARVPHARIRVLDPYPEPLARWYAVTASTGMTYLRSPIVHHLHYDQRALGVFARIHDKAPYTRFIPTFSRPTLELFNRHSRYLIEKYHLAALRIQGVAQRLTRLHAGWRVETSDGGLEARRVVLAMGSGNQPNYPDWARTLQQQGAPVQHIFDPDFQLAAPRSRGVVMIGGGISAAQTALALCRVQSEPVTVIMRHPVRIHDFDSDPCWMNDLCLRDFHRITDFAQRRDMIQVARHPGTMPLDVAQAFQSAAASGHLRVYQAEVQSATDYRSHISLTLSQGDTLEAAHILLATGYRYHPRSIPWLDDAIQSYNLPVMADGFPMIDPALRWADGLFVSGALAELEIGPAARNIIGARMTGQRLLQV